MSEWPIISFKSDAALAHSVAERWIREVESKSASTTYGVALSGGRIARSFFVAAACLAQERKVPVTPLQFFWADERCVPPEDPESNYALAHRCLLAPLKVPPAQIHRVRGEAAPAQAAGEAAADLRAVAPRTAQGIPVLDLVLLGMGEDGHVASLFPKADESVEDPHLIYVPVTGSKPPAQRITLTYAALTAARQVWVLASGPGKARAWRESLRAGGQTPLARLLRRRESTLLFTDLA